MATELEFCCPKCGGHDYAANSTTPGALAYRCRGSRSGGCRFSWGEADSWKVFQLVTRKPFADADEYAARLREGG